MQDKQQPLNPAVQEFLDNAKAAFKKMAALGPVVWLFGRMPGKQHLFLQDLDLSYAYNQKARMYKILPGLLVLGIYLKAVAAASFQAGFGKHHSGC